ncbi:hypothetical protein QTG54_001204 [Skeletonema marinoi]|uniref:Uncharacterized protein n=1 Tax=Skeletonema marinoi TaxID=267567 RepID=A0AAD9DKM2_9STRA|nr:hypothetical protein QTG54_001204 [Skeletonema marinoi]
MPNKYNIRANRQVLDNFIRKRAWIAFRDHFCEYSVEDARAIVEYHNNTTHRTLLHSLCDISNSSPPPPDLLYVVAESSPRSLLLQDSGRTPLHLCVIRGYSMKAIISLLSLAEKCDSLDKQHLLLATDSRGCTPLLAALYRFDNINESIVRYLVNQDVNGASLLIPSAGAKKKQKQHAPLKYVASSESIFVGGGLESSDDLLRFMLVKTYLARMKEMYQNDHDGDTYIAENESDVCILQAAILCFDLFGSPKTASSIISCIIRNRLHQIERLNSRTDAAGNLTIHIACISSADYNNQILRLVSRETDYGINSDDCTLLEYIMKASGPNALLFQNKEKDLPLHCAIKSKRSWLDVQRLIDSCPTSASTRTGKGELPLHLAMKCGNCSSDYIMKLWEKSPEAAIISDNDGLYPFQLAAIAISGRVQKPHRKSKKKVTSKSENVWDALSVSYFFLRECPSLIQSCCL